MHIIGQDFKFLGLQATGLYDDLVPKTPILGNAMEVGPEVVAKALECLGEQDDASVDDLEYYDCDGD